MLYFCKQEKQRSAAPRHNQASLLLHSVCTIFAPVKQKPNLLKSIIMEPIINSQLPEFKVQAFQNGSFKTVTNEDVKGKWAIFFFYPADFTFVCPTELVDIAEKYDQFQAMGVEVYSVSTDSHFVHKAWHDASESIGRNADELLRKVEAAQFVATHDGEVCPAKWKKGGATLKPSIDLVGKI